MFGIPILWTIGIILVMAGAVLSNLGVTGRAIGTRKTGTFVPVVTESIDTTSPGGRLVHLFSAFGPIRAGTDLGTHERTFGSGPGPWPAWRPPARRADQQDETEHRVVHGEHRHHPQDRGCLIEVARHDRKGTGRPDHGREPERTGGVQTAVLELTNPSALLPDFSGLHPALRTDGGSQTPEGHAMPIRSFRSRMHGSWLTSFRTQPLHVFAAGHVEPLGAAWDFGPVITRLLLRERPSHRATGSADFV